MDLQGAASSFLFFEPSHARLDVSLPLSRGNCSYLDKFSFRAMWTVSRRSHPFDWMMPSRHASPSTSVCPSKQRRISAPGWRVPRRNISDHPPLRKGREPQARSRNLLPFSFFPSLFSCVFLRRDLPKMRISADPRPTWSAFRALACRLTSL